MSETKYFFSVIIPLYNKEATVERAIRSALNQTVQDFEIIVVNDGSTDNGPDIVAAINDSRIHLIHQNNQGVSAARNRGIAEAKYDLIAFIDADDEWLTEFLETIRRMVLRYSECGLYATRYFLHSPFDKQQPALISSLPDDFEGILKNYFQIAINGAPPIWSSATCARKKALLEIGGFPVGVTSGEDLLTWARLAARFKVAYSMSCLSIFYQTPAEIYMTGPSRIPEDDDVVGRGLAGLLDEVEPNNTIFLCGYCALWHKMRASCYLRAGLKSRSREEIYHVLKYEFNIRVVFYCIISFLPLSCIRWAFQLGGAK